MGGARKNQTAMETSAISAKEEMLLLLFRGISAHQQRELILEMQAMVEANTVIRRRLKGKRLHAVSNEAVRAAFRDVPQPKRAATKPSKKKGRDPGAAMGDYLDD